MVSKKKITISWSGGKDSALALYKILLSGEYEVAHLHTVFNASNKRVGLHGVHENLIEKQAEAIGVPLVKLYLEESDNHDRYEALMKHFYNNCFREGIQAVMFGDIFLEDLREYRMRMLTTARLEGVFPIWKIESARLLEDFLNVGFKTLLCSAKSEYFEAADVGKIITTDFVQRFSNKIDICGENGEFHTFVVDGPIFRSPVKFSLGEVTSRSYQYKVKRNDGTVEEQETAFWFQDINVFDLKN